MKSKYLCLIFVFIFSCSDASVDANLKIVGGRVPDAQNPGTTSTVSFTEFRQHNCSGVIVSQDLILTAAHCVYGKVDFPQYNEIIFSSNIREYDVERDIRQVTEMKIHPSYILNHLQNDIAWVRFSGGLPEGFRASTILMNEDLLLQGLPLTLVGYGHQFDVGSVFPNPLGIRMTVNTILREYHPEILYPGIIFYGPTPNQGACAGDSGGPAYTQINNQWYLLGTLIGPDQVISGVETCSAGEGMYTQIGRHIDWIEKSSGQTLQKVSL